MKINIKLQNQTPPLPTAHLVSPTWNYQKVSEYLVKDFAWTILAGKVCPR